MKVQDKRSEIMQAALQLLTEKGFDRVPMPMIADRAHVAVGTIYIYFTSKDALITELFSDLEKDIWQTMQKSRTADGSIRNNFLNLTRTMVKYLTANPLHFRYMEQYFNSPFGISLRRDMIFGKLDRPDIFLNTFKEGISQNILKDLPLGVLFSLSIAPLVFLLRDHVLGFIELDDALIGKVTEACWDAIKK